MNGKRMLLQLPHTGVVKLDRQNPWVLISRQGFSWGQLLTSNLVTAILVWVWTLIWIV